MCQNFNTVSNTILQELNKIKDMEYSEGLRMPIPNYLFIQRYGRRAQEQMEEILPKIGKKEWFLFKPEECTREEGLIRKFRMDLLRHADTGKEFAGCCLIELSKEMLIKEDMVGFLEYLKENEKKLYYLFTIKNDKDAALVQKYIEQYFFTRVVYAEDFSIEEQFDIIRNTCEEYGFDISHKAEIIITGGLKNRKWKTDEHVAYRLQNETNVIIYEAILEDKTEERVISAEQSMKLLKNLQKRTETEKVFGFQQREYEKQEEYQYEENEWDEVYCAGRI